MLYEELNKKIVSYDETELHSDEEKKVRKELKELMNKIQDLESEENDNE